MKVINNLKTTILLSLISLILLGVAGTATATEPVVVVGINSDVSSISTVEFQRLWLGKTDAINGKTLETIECKGADAVKNDFCVKFLGKSATEVKKYFIKEALKGGATPPAEVANLSALMEKLSGSTSAISFMEKGQVDAGKVKIVAIVKD